MPSGAPRRGMRLRRRSIRKSGCAFFVPFVLGLRFRSNLRIRLRHPSAIDHFLSHFLDAQNSNPGDRRSQKMPKIQPVSCEKKIRGAGHGGGQNRLVLCRKPNFGTRSHACADFDRRAKGFKSGQPFRFFHRKISFRLFNDARMGHQDRMDLQTLQEQSHRTSGL